MEKTENLQPAAPGQKIRELLSERGMLQKEFALRMGLTEKHVSKLINGEVQLTVDVSLKLETVLGIPAAEWNAMEAVWREMLLREEYDAHSKEEAALAQLIPYAEMAKLGWVPETGELKEKVRRLREFFEVTDLALIETWQISGAACRGLSMQEKEDLTVVAWIQAARKKARENAGAAYGGKGLLEVAKALRSFTSEKPATFLPVLTEKLAEQGVCLTFLPRLRGLFVQSAAILSGNRVVIAMTEKKMTDGEFWFRLYRELGHVSLGHVWQQEGTTEQDERDASLWARNALLARSEYDAFLEKGSFTEKSVLEFAGQQGIAPGILLERLQHDGLVGGGSLNRLKKEYDFGDKRKKAKEAK